MEQSPDSLLARLRTTTGNARLTILGELAAIHDPVTEARPYELLCTRIATEVPDVVELCHRAVPDPDQPIPVRVLAAVTGATACRRSRRRAEGQEMLRHLKHLESDYPILLHMLALTYRGGEQSELRWGRRLAEQAYARMPNNPGVAHSLATFLTDLAYQDDKDSGDELLLEEALRLTNEALRSESRARFYYTRARINRKRGRFTEAKDDLAAAIQAESWMAIDYRHRLTDYLVESSLVDADRATQRLMADTTAAIRRSEARVDQFTAQLDEATKRFRSEQTRTIETLAFFASVLALVQFTAVSLSRGFPFWQSLVLIGALGAMLFGAVFAGSWLIRRGRQS